MFAINKKPTRLLKSNIDYKRINNDFQMIIAKVREVMAIPNQAAYLAMMDAYDRLKITPFFKGQIKKELNLAIKAFNAFDRALHYGTWNDRDFFNPAELTAEEISEGKQQITREDVWDHYFTVGAMAHKRYAKHLEMLRWQILQCFTKVQMPYREEMSYVCIGNSVLEWSIFVFDRLMEEYKKEYHVDCSKVFSPFRMYAIHYHFNKASYYLALKNTAPGQEIDLNSQKNIRLAFEIFEKSIMEDLQNSSSAIEAAIEDAYLFSEEDRQKFQQYIKENKNEN